VCFFRDWRVRGGGTPPYRFGLAGGPLWTRIADRAAEEAVGAAFAAAINVAIATLSQSARMQFFSRVFDAIRSNRVPAFVVVGGAVLPPTTAPLRRG